MKINNTGAPTPPNRNNKVTFSGNKGQKAFKWVSDQCNVSNKGELTRVMFLVVSSIFMVGARFLKARGDDERREVLTRDIPAIVLSIYGAPVLNAGLAYAATKRSGIPVVNFKEGAEKKLKNAKFVTQKQVKEWYSNLKDLKNPLVTFSETIHRHGGDLNKVMKKLGEGFESGMESIVGKKGASNEEIITAFKNAQKNKTESFTNLETKIKNISSENELFKAAQKSQAHIKLAGIAFTAAILGYLLPRLNIVTTREKYKHKNESQSAQTNPQTQPAQEAQAPQAVAKSEKAEAFQKFI